MFRSMGLGMVHLHLLTVSKNDFVITVKNQCPYKSLKDWLGNSSQWVLWYQGMSPERKFAEIQDFRINDLSENFFGQRFLSLGWLPGKGIGLDDIISGKLDDYFYDYFSDSIDKNKNFGIASPIWFRPMNEFNSNWVPWGLARISSGRHGGVCTTLQNRSELLSSTSLSGRQITAVILISFGIKWSVTGPEINMWTGLEYLLSSIRTICRNRK